jgi:hypothetical protein
VFQPSPGQLGALGEPDEPGAGAGDPAVKLRMMLLKLISRAAQVLRVFPPA